MLKMLLVLLLSFSFSHACALCGGKSSFVTVFTEASLEHDTLQSIHTVWEFDAGTSKDLIKLYHLDKGIEASEKQRMYDALEQYQIPYFMTSILINGKNTPFKAENFTLSLEKNNVHIAFDIPLNYALHDQNSIEIVFVDSMKTVVFLEDLNNTTIRNQTAFNVKKSNGFKIIKEMMATTNYIKLDIAR